MGIYGCFFTGFIGINTFFAQYKHTLLVIYIVVILIYHGE